VTFISLNEVFYVKVFPILITSLCHIYFSLHFIFDTAVPITNKFNLTTHSCHSYPMWNFTCMYILNNLPLMYEFLHFCGFWQSPISSPLPMCFFFFFFSSLTCHQWNPRTLFMGTRYQSCTLIHGTQTKLSCPWEPSTTPYSSTIGNVHLLGFLYFRTVCVGFMSLPCANYNCEGSKYMHHVSTLVPCHIPP